MAAILPIVSETAREREAYKYDPLEILTGDQADRTAATAQWIPDSVLTAQPDPALTAFAQLGLHRLDGSRSLISLFDRSKQHIVAEAQRLSLPQPWLCGAAVDRTTSICEHVLVGMASCPVDELPVSVISDLHVDGRFCGTVRDPTKRFYAGVPIRSPSGINIGVFCVFDAYPRPKGMSTEDIKWTQDLSRTIMGYLESKRSIECLRRERCMVRGLGSFVEGKTSLSMSGHEVNEEDDVAAAAFPRKKPSSLPQASLPPGIDPLKRSIERVFSKASSIIRESLEVDGVLFLDATVRSFGGLVHGEMASPAVLGKIATDESSSDESPNQSPVDEDSECRVLGFATADRSSINGHVPLSEHTKLREYFLQRLLRRYPQGKIFTYEANGTAQSDSSGSEADESSSIPGSTTGLTRVGTKSHLHAAANIIQLFPGARSVMMVPLWDAQRSRWFAGGFFWTRRASRIFTPENEISYLRVFGLTAMAEVARLSTKVSDKTKTDILGSISHELRSPLHGVVGAVDLLRHTSLDSTQESIVKTIQTSGRTLLDTIDHLLEHSRMSNVTKLPKSERRAAMLGHATDTGLLTPHQSNPDEMPAVELDQLIEESVDSVLDSYGFSCYGLATPSHPHRSSKRPRTAGDASSQSAHSAGYGYPGSVQVYLNIQQCKSWAFSTHPGGIRRIVMNLVSNALKFTKAGHIQVQLRQETPLSQNKDKPTVNVCLTVADTGKGMSEDYIRNHIFTPFSQEDHFAPGTGLGLSLVRNISSALGGNITVSSRSGEGTSISVVIPLAFAQSGPSEAEISTLQQEQARLYGKTILIEGFSCKQTPYAPVSSLAFESHVDPTLELSFHYLSSMCKEWFGVDVEEGYNAVISGSSEESHPPDIAIYNINSSDHSFVERTSSPLLCPHVYIGTEAQQAASRRSNDYVAILTHPIGPRKLAAAFAHARKLWEANLQQQASESPSPPSDSFSASSSSPLIFMRNGARASGGGCNIASPSSLPPPARSPRSTDVKMIDSPVAEVAASFSFDNSRPSLPSLSPGEQGMANNTSQQSNISISATTPFSHSQSHHSHYSRPPPHPLLRYPSSSSATHSNSHNNNSLGTPTPLSHGSCLEKGQSIIIVDDNAINLRILEAYMKKLHLPYTTATNGLEALETYVDDPERYSCMLTDVSMPVMSGLESTMRIRQLERERGIGISTEAGTDGNSNITAERKIKDDNGALAPTVAGGTVSGFENERALDSEILRESAGGTGKISKRCKVIALTGLGGAHIKQDAFASGVDLCLTKPVGLNKLVDALRGVGIMAPASLAPES